MTFIPGEAEHEPEGTFKAYAEQQGEATSADFATLVRGNPISKWLRKNSFVRDLRKFVKHFRIMEIETEVYQETTATTMPPTEPEEETPPAQTYIPTGRGVVIIKLVGLWRVK